MNCLTSATRRIAVAVAKNPMQTLLGVLATLVCVYIVAYPFTVVRFPPITDLPFHAAEASILRHYLDPAWHFREQFAIHPIEAPYISMYAMGAFFALFMPMVWAAKMMAIVMLGLLPAGMAVLFYGMKKSPLWGILGLAFVWCTLTQWGFLNHMGAVGLFAMSVGCTLLVVDRPTRLRQVALAGVLLFIFFTHVFRFPFAIAAVVGVAIAMYPATRKLAPILLPIAPSLVVFGIWQVVRRKTLGASLDPIVWDKERFKARLAEIPQYAFNTYSGTIEQEWFEQAKRYGVWLFAITAIVFVVQGRWRGRPFRAWWWGAAVTWLPLAIAGVFVAAYLTLPMSIGVWWYVYPREITTAGFVALGAMPDLPRQWWLRLPVLVLVSIFVGRLAMVNAREWAEFETVNSDFVAISRVIPPSPKLMYLVMDHSGSNRLVSPFVHMPAWVQAERGGWLSFHFVSWDVHPIRYREAGPAVPPPRPERWEWTPYLFNAERDAPWFDTFLVRSATPPDYLFSSDPKIRQVRHEGKWWLYRRQ